MANHTSKPKPGNLKIEGAYVVIFVYILLPICAAIYSMIVNGHVALNWHGAK